MVQPGHRAPGYGTAAAGLPDFPWERLEPAKARAAAHPGGLVDLSIGTPVDPVPEPVRAALVAAADAPGYPRTAGSPQLRDAMLEWLATSCRADPQRLDVLPTVGSKELIVALPRLLGLGPDDPVVIPSVCYPSYEVGALLAGAPVTRVDDPAQAPPGTRLVWLNTPANPTGAVLDPARLRSWLAWARSQEAVLASDECYLTLGWSVNPESLLGVCDGRYDGVLAVHSLSKRSNLAGYRAGFVAGDPVLLQQLFELRRHAGMMVPAPVQQAMTAALRDETHAARQRGRYAARREWLLSALAGAGFEVAHCEAGLYLWATGGEDCWRSVDWFADRGILVSPGAFYGAGGARYVRLALTATDERVAAAAERLR